MPSALSQLFGKWLVVKVGGELTADPDALARSVGTAIHSCLKAGARVAMVHGAGPQATLLATQLGLPTHQVAGLRVTDEATLRLMKLAYGEASVGVAAAMLQAKVPAICTSGVSAGLVRARRRNPVSVAGIEGPVDYGLVGDVVAIDVALLERLANAGTVPVLSFLAAAGDGTILNVNADSVAAHLAASLGAARVALVSNVAGVLRNRKDPTSRIPRLSIRLARELLDTGAIHGGMIPKVEAALDLLARGVGAVHIVGSVPELSLLDELQNPGSQGTVFVNG